MPPHSSPDPAKGGEVKTGSIPNRGYDEEAKRSSKRCAGMFMRLCKLELLIPGIQQPQIEYETLHNPFQKGKQFIHIVASPASTKAFPSNQQFSTPPWLLLLLWCLLGNRWQLLSSRRLSPGP
uniref:Uncharacterized protein n=1 Tax=Oryza meridionalis TaxID=40149 RepID=A0A0E0BY48_9ORYZ